MKRCIIIITMFILLITTGCSNINNNVSKNSRYFYNTISLIKDEKYKKAYEQSKKIKDSKDRRIIETIFIYKLEAYESDLYNAVDEYIEECDNLIDTAHYNEHNIFTVSEEQQNKVNKINDDKIKPFDDMQNKFPPSILPGSSLDYYAASIKYYDSVVNSCSDLANKLQNQQRPLLQAIETGISLLDKKEKLNYKYPIENIPEEYIILLDLDIKK